MDYRNPRIDQLFEAASVEMDPQKRKVLFDEAQQILHDEQPVIFLMESYNFV